MNEKVLKKINLYEDDLKPLLENCIKNIEDLALKYHDELQNNPENKELKGYLKGLSESVEIIERQKKLAYIKAPLKDYYKEEL